MLRDAEARYRDGPQPISVETSDVMHPHQDQGMRAPARTDVINTANVRRDRDRDRDRGPNRETVRDRERGTERERQSGKERG